MFLLTFKLVSKIYAVFQSFVNLVFIYGYPEPGPMSDTLQTVIHLISPEKEVFCYFDFQIRKWRILRC